MILAIRGEIQNIEDGKMDLNINPLKMAPHTQEQVINSKWDRPYTRELGAFPVVRVKFLIIKKKLLLITEVLKYPV